jgi:hypothetical protein
MKVLRAYAYFQLISIYGGVPLITKPFELKDDFNVQRNTYDECMDFIIKELDEASNLLPLNYNTANKGRITKGTALAVKSRALLYAASPLNNPGNAKEKWQKAADAAKAVIDLNLYSLYSDYKTLFLQSAAYNSEVIWARPYNYVVDPEGLNVELSQYPNGFGGQGWINPLQNLVDEYETVNGLLPKNDPSYNSQNPYVNRDPRFYATILYDGAPFKGRAVETFLPKGKDTNEGIMSPNFATQTSYYLKKYILESVTNPSNTNAGSSPWIYFRYAEILLNYAEAMFMLNEEGICRQYLNKIRSRAGVNMPPVTESGSALLERLQHERRIELAFEEHRWFDVRRWKIAMVVLNEPAKKMSIRIDPVTGLKNYTIETLQQRAFSEKNYLVPIPQAEINKAPLLVQNPGY